MIIRYATNRTITRHPSTYKKYKLKKYISLKSTFVSFISNITSEFLEMSKYLFIHTLSYSYNFDYLIFNSAQFVGAL